ncbi:uncharacterized protein LOC143714229 [Siphateles boraxobius]|uniref:uncharacterized protein LOC143714229 n=1 Tax=Siphateles boraxobius TaxID=180520 RepID=UPI004062C117
MAESKELIVSDFSWSPEFVQDLHTSAERTALLYHLSYRCLGSIPKLERLIREQAVETQLLFGSSETVLMKCVGTSSNLVTSLFPGLKQAIEMNKPKLAVTYLEKTKTWIDDIIRAVDDIVNRYDQQNQRVAECISDVIQEQNETEVRQTQQSVEMKRVETAVANLKEELEKNAKDIEEIEKTNQMKNSEIQKCAVNVSRKKHSVGILSSLVPHTPSFINSIYNAITAPGVDDKKYDLSVELSRLTSEKRKLQNKEAKLNVELIDLQLKLDSSNIKQGLIQASVVHLKDVHSCLSEIQKILVQLKKFWEKVEFMLERLKNKHFVNEFLTDDHDTRNQFLQSIEIAIKFWNTFGQNCQKANSILYVQSKDAYQFLETSPSSLSEGHWKEQYETVMKKLNQINFQEPSTAAITECHTDI